MEINDVVHEGVLALEVMFRAQKLLFGKGINVSKYLLVMVGKL